MSRALRYNETHQPTVVRDGRKKSMLSSDKKNDIFFFLGGGVGEETDDK